jgi:hypothetical protein
MAITNDSSHQAIVSLDEPAKIGRERRKSRGEQKARAG